MNAGFRTNVYFLLVLGIFFGACTPKPGEPPEKFYDYDRTQPLNAEVEAVSDTGHFSLYHVTYSSVRNQRVTALHAVPKSGQPPFPAVVFLHGLGDSKTRDYMQNGNYIMTRAGYAVFRIDAYRHGERKKPGDDLGGGKKLPYWGRDLITQTVFDLRRAVDFLETRPEVDAGRIGFFGISLGGFIGTVFSGIEPRARVPVIALAGAGISILFADGVIPDPADEFLYYIEPLNFVEKISPRPLLMINARKDEIVPPAASELLYDRAKQPKKIIWYDTTHRRIPQEEAFGEAVKWYDEHLR